MRLLIAMWNNSRVQQWEIIHESGETMIEMWKNSQVQWHSYSNVNNLKSSETLLVMWNVVTHKFREVVISIWVNSWVSESAIVIVDIQYNKANETLWEMTHESGENVIMWNKWRANERPFMSQGSILSWHQVKAKIK